jgi:hypothetical protein
MVNNKGVRRTVIIAKELGSKVNSVRDWPENYQMPHPNAIVCVDEDCYISYGIDEIGKGFFHTLRYNEMNDRFMWVEPMSDPEHVGRYAIAGRSTMENVAGPSDDEIKKIGVRD